MQPDTDMTDLENTGAPEAPGTEPTLDDRLQTLYPDDVPDKAEETKAEGEPGTPQAEADAYQLTAPEGVTIDTQLLTAATPVLRDLGLSNEQASKLVPLASIVQERMVTEMANEHAQMRADWMRQAKADTSIGGAKWDETIKIASGALTECGAGPGSSVRKLLDQSGLGNHPEVIRLFRNVGLRLRSSGSGAATGQSRENILYPND